MPYKDPEKRRAFQREWRRTYDSRSYEARAYVKAYRKSRTYKQYGLDTEKVKALIESQGNLCLVCGEPFGEVFDLRPAVDHNHETGKVRGILHVKCNRAIGQFGDDPALLRKAVEYLEKAS